MTFNIKLFVHGVPNGQDKWGNSETESKYLDTFYTPNYTSNAGIAKQLVVDIKILGGVKSAYYTYVFSNGVVFDSASRKGGFVALTLRLNHYYADTVNIYNVLDAAFNKYIVGPVVQFSNEGGCHFKVSKFEQVSDHLLALEKELQNYLMNFSSNADLLPLDTFAVSNLGAGGTINLGEAAPNVVYDFVAKHGKISVSPFYPSTREQTIIKEKEAEIGKIRNDFQLQIKSVQTEKEQGIQNVKNQYAQMEASFKQCSEDLQKTKREKEDLNKEVIFLKKAGAQLTQYKQRLDQAEGVINNIKIALGGVVPVKSPQSAPKPVGSLTLINIILTAFTAFCMLCIVCVSLLGGCESREAITEKQLIHVVDSITQKNVEESVRQHFNSLREYMNNGIREPQTGS